MERDLNKNPWFTRLLHASTNNMTERSKVLNGCWMRHDSIEALQKLEDMTEMGCGRHPWDPGHSEQGWVVYSPFQHNLGHSGENNKEQTKKKWKQTALPRALGEAKELLAWDAAKCMWVQKAVSQTPQRKNSHSLKYKTQPFSELKMLKIKRVILEKCHQRLALLL